MRCDAARREQHRYGGGLHQSAAEDGLLRDSDAGDLWILVVAENSSARTRAPVRAPPTHAVIIALAERLIANQTEVMQVLNASPESAGSDKTRDSLRKVFQFSVEVAIPDNLIVMDVLRSSFWREIPRNGQVAIINQGHFVGAIDRKGLFDAVFGTRENSG